MCIKKKTKMWYWRRTKRRKLGLAFEPFLVAGASDSFRGAGRKGCRRAGEQRNICAGVSVLVVTYLEEIQPLLGRHQFMAHTLIASVCLNVPRRHVQESVGVVAPRADEVFCIVLVARG